MFDPCDAFAIAGLLQKATYDTRRQAMSDAANQMLNRWCEALKTGKACPLVATEPQGAISRDGIAMLDSHGLLAAAFDLGSDIGPLHPAAKRRFLKVWVRSGHSIRHILQDDALLFNALWHMLPPYYGTEPLQLYRGQLWGYRPDDTTFIGASWTDDFALAHKFALVGAANLEPPGEAREQQIEARRSLGQPAVIRATIAPDIIICAVHENGKSWLLRDREFVVDPRQLRPDDLSMITTDELNASQLQQQSSGVGGAA